MGEGHGNKKGKKKELTKEDKGESCKGHMQHAHAVFTRAIIVLVNN